MMGRKKLDEQKGFNLEELKNNDTFIDIVMHASQVALRNSQQEKLQALRNAVINSALPNTLEESVQQMFVNFIDTLTVWHIKLLDLVSDPEAWAKRHHHTFPSLMVGGFSTILESAFPELKGRQSFYDQLGKDLAYQGLANIESFHVTTTGRTLTQKRTTELGDRFMKLISDPFVTEGN